MSFKNTKNYLSWRVTWGERENRYEERFKTKKQAEKAFKELMSRKDSLAGKKAYKNLRISKVPK